MSREGVITPNLGEANRTMRCLLVQRRFNPVSDNLGRKDVDGVVQHDEYAASIRNAERLLRLADLTIRVSDKVLDRAGHCVVDLSTQFFAIGQVREDLRDWPAAVKNGPVLGITIRREDGIDLVRRVGRQQLYFRDDVRPSKKTSGFFISRCSGVSGRSSISSAPGTDRVKFMKCGYGLPCIRTRRTDVCSNSFRFCNE